MASTNDPKEAEAAEPQPSKPAKKAAAPRQFRVLIAGISLPGKAPAYQGEIVDEADFGSAERVAKLLELQRIEEVA